MIKRLNTGKPEKINLYTRDDRPTFWYKIYELLLIQFQDSVAHLLEGVPSVSHNSISLVVLKAYEGCHWDNRIQKNDDLLSCKKSDGLFSMCCC